MANEILSAKSQFPAYKVDFLIVVVIVEAAIVKQSSGRIL